MSQMIQRKQTRIHLSKGRLILSVLLALSLWPQPKIAQAQWQSSGNNIYFNNGNVGIGATDPVTKLQVADSIYADRILNLHAGKDVLGGKVGTFVGSWDSTGQITLGSLNFAQTTSAGNSIEWTLDEDDQWGINSLNDSIRLVVGGWWYPGDTGSFTAKIQYYNGNTAAWADGCTFSGSGVYSCPNPVPYNNPPYVTKIRLYVQSVSTYAHFGYIQLWSAINPYGWIKNLEAAKKIYAGDAYVTGSVGIGTTVPNRSLTIANSTGANYMNIKDGIREVLLGVDSNGAILSAMTSHDLILRTGSNSERMRITASGNVGIGTINPATKLELGGIRPIQLDTDLGSIKLKGESTSWATLYGFTSTNGTDLGGLWAYGGDTYLNWFNIGTSYNDGMFTVLSSGKVGIGTTAPAQKLHVKGSNYSMAVFEDDTNPYLIMRHGTAAAGLKNIALQQINGDLAVSTMNDTYGWTGNLILIKNNGNVGIGTGTSAPASKLHVVGDVTVTGNIAAKYQDVAEWVPSSRAMLAGTVVVLDTAHTNQVLPSEQAYDTRVAGVVSDMPGIILGEAGDGKVKVATTGRVKVKVDATKKPVQVGDLLVTSDKEGVAMKSEPMVINGRPFHQPGTILGKALEPLKEGEGEILVLLSMQ